MKTGFYTYNRYQGTVELESPKGTLFSLRLQPKGGIDIPNSIWTKDGFTIWDLRGRVQNILQKLLKTELETTIMVYPDSVAFTWEPA